MNREKLREWRKKLTKHMRDGHRCEFRIDCEAVVQSIDAILAEPAQESANSTPSAGEAVDYPLTGRVCKRRDEWVLELTGSINDTAFISRHTEPLTTAPEDVPGLPSLYTSPPAPTADKAWPDDARRCIERALRLLDNVTADDSGSDDLGAAENALRNALATLTAAAPQTDERGRPLTYWGGLAAPQAPVVTETMVEAVGSGLYIYWNDVSNSCRDKYREKVRRILTAALQQPASGEGDAIQQEAGRRIIPEGGSDGG
jgi:hypothetical protein